MTGFVLNMAGFVLNMTGFVQVMTGYVLKPHLEIALEIVEVGLRSRRPIVAQWTRTR